MNPYFRDFFKNLFLALVVLTFFRGSLHSQSLSINEFSNGPSGTQEYIEFIVMDTGATYDCVNLTFPCVDIRGWIIDDNNGYHGSNGVASGCNRFSNDPFWSCIPVGTIITVYNGTDPNPSLPPDDLSMSDGNCSLVIPIENTTLFENNTNTPGAVACDYPATGWNPGGVWFRIGMRNGGDCVRIVDLAGCEVFSLSYGDVNLNSVIYFPGAGTDDVFYFNGGDPTIQANWTQGCAGDIAACGSDDQTPGIPNSILNEDYISQFNNNCTPYTALSLSANNISDASCFCDGSATIQASGSIPGYTYEWYDASYNTIGQSGSTANNLCQGIYNCIVESSIGCIDTIQVTIAENCGQFGHFASAPMIQNCVNNQFYNTTWSTLPDQINPSGILYDGIDFGPFFVNSNTLILNGGEVKTWKDPSANVCGAKLHYIVYPISAPPANPTFTILDLPFKESCNIATNSFPTGGPCFSSNDQKWAKEDYGIDLTLFPVDDYVLEIFYSVPGSNSSSSGCNDTLIIDNGGTNFIAFFQLKEEVIITATNTEFCVGDSSLLSSNYLAGNLWSTSETTQSIYASNGGNYTLTMDLGNSCPLDTENIAISTIPNSQSSTEITICDDLLPYSWNGLTFNAAGSQTATLSSAAGCDSLATLNLSVNTSISNTDTQTACDSYTWIDGNTYTTSNNSATWTLTNASGCDSTVTLDLTITNSNTGTDVQTACDSYTWIDGNTYTTSNNSATWTLTNASGCDSTVTLDLTINNTPSFTVSGTDPSICNANDGSITISGLNPFTDYSLGYDSLSVASQIITITSDASGEYIISGLLAGLYADFNIELNSCSFTLNETVDLNNPGAPSLDALSSITACDTYTLPAIAGTNLSGNQSYYTQSNGAGTPLSEGDVVSSTQTIYIYDILGTCADESNFTITIDYTPSLTNPGPQEVCESYFLPLSITGTNLSGNENYYSNLQSNGGTIITDAITSSQTVYIYDANGNCSNEISFEVTVNPLPSLVSFTGEGTYCEGGDVNNLIVEVSGAPDYTLDYTLNGNPTTISSSNSSIDLGNTSGTYVLTALADNACGISLDQTQTIIVNPLPSTPTVSEDASYCSNVVAEDLQASGSSGSYSWYSDASLSELIGSNQSYSPDMMMGTTTYYVTATENGCEGLPAEVSITFENCEIIIPTAFTPDDDQVNDTWNLGDIDVIYPNNVVSVYNRLGNKVYESDQGAYSQRPWNGTFNEKALPVASYYFIIEFNDNSTQNKTGIVSIVK